MMKITQAREEARKRWGISGFATVSRIHRVNGKGIKGVGRRSGFAKEEIKIYYGWATTWEEAFRQADIKIEKEKAELEMKIQRVNLFGRYGK